MNHFVRLFKIFFLFILFFCLYDYFFENFIIHIFNFFKKFKYLYKENEQDNKDNLFRKVNKSGNDINTIFNNEIGLILNIPIVFYLDGSLLPFTYTAIMSILEHKYKNTYYIFFLLVPFNFSKSHKIIINKLKNQKKCSINFIYIKYKFEDLHIIFY